jgi:hypothetical protein
LKNAHTLVELMMGLVVTAVVLGSLYVVRSGSTPWTGQIQMANATETSAVQVRLRELVCEVQDATRLFYPLDGKAAIAPEIGFSGLGFVDARGETILYYYQPEKDSLPGKVLRVNVNQKKHGKEDQPQVAFENVHYFRVNVAPAAAGTQPSLVNMDIAFRVDPRDPQNLRAVNYITSIFVRNVERNIPDDPAIQVPPP